MQLAAARRARWSRAEATARTCTTFLTGSQPDGTAFPEGEDRTCGNWTKSGEGSAMVGHHDRMGLSDTAEAKSWNSSHPSRGCSQDALRGTGGNGLLYCFAGN